MPRLVAQGGLELGEAAQLEELHLIEPRQLIELHELIVPLHSQILAFRREHADDRAGDGGGAVAFEDADALVALLHVEPAQILIALDGVADALVAQVGFAELHPLGAELGVNRQQRHKAGGKGRLAAGALGADNLIDGDFNESQVHPSGAHGLHQNLVEHLGIGVATPEHIGAVVLLPLLEGALILIHGFGKTHASSSLFTALQLDVT